ncbi:hypothetical protein ACFX2I_027745 [Malus domestica]
MVEDWWGTINDEKYFSYPWLQIDHIRERKIWGDRQAENIEIINGQQWLHLGETVEIYVGDDESRWAPVGVLEDPLKVVVD